GLLALARFFEGSGAATAAGDQTPLTPELRAGLSESAYIWLCACAVYPELHWHLTLHLASLPFMPDCVLTEDDLLRLFRSDACRDGALPHEIRERLIADLTAEQQDLVRKAVIDLLQANPAPDGSIAADARRMQIAFQRYHLFRNDRRRRRQAER